VSLSQEPAFSALRNHFVCGYKNIMQEGYAGDSGVHPIDGNAVNTTNGAGPHNLQTFVMTADGTVLHCLPGFWSSTDLAAELEVAEKLSYIWQDKAISAEDKAILFKRMHLEHFNVHSQELVARSHLQGFDAQHIYKNRKELSDCISDKEAISAVEDAHKLPYEAFKTTDKIMHERMATRPFQNYNSFDIGTYTSYGCNHYDKGENEMEGGPSTLALKGKTLRSISKPTVMAVAPQLNRSASPACLKEKEQEKQIQPQLFVALAKQGLWPEAFRCADKYIRGQFTQPGGYEMRSLAALQLGWYQQAYDDASRALWLGSKHSSATILRARAATKLKPLVYLNTKSL
jgi:hypothetical protein